MPYKFIYFDLDDTLLDHKSAEQSALRDVHEHFSLFDEISSNKLVDAYHDINKKQWYLYSRGKVSRDELQRNRFEQTLQQLTLNGDRYDEVGTHYLQCYQKHWRWIDGAEKTYKQIARNYPVGILTNGFAETQRKKVSKFDFHKSAKQIVISEEIDALKPDPKVFRHATELADVSSDDILYIGDSFTSDIQGGSCFGWNTAWYTQNGSQELRQKADFVFSDFNQLIQLLNLQVKDNAV